MESFADLKEAMFGQQSGEAKSVVAAKAGIMIIDDNLDIIEALTTLLQPRYQVIACLNYEEVKQKLTPEIKVILLDIKMAGKDGVEVFKLLKEQRADLRIIFHSAYPGSSEKAAEVEQLEHSGYLTKGEYNGAELLNLIEQTINQAGEARSRASQPSH